MNLELSAGWLGMFMAPRPVRAPRLLRGLATQGVQAVDVAAGNHHSLVATQIQECWGFGSNRWWQLGLPEPADIMEPTQVGSRKGQGALFK
jgi:alpha-tubulin suppressor-like RCC1 family protein